ncbi:GAF domain-containing protein [Paenibacillus sp. MMO-177]|uniref:GAF domain-containing protein n=1 Tax=Paenibacillus sp. MMO-177 TaxID=3081289 RepID=UPI00301B5BBE
MSGTPLATDPVPASQRDKGWYSLKLFTAGLLVSVILIFTMAGANATLDTVFPGLFTWCFKRVYGIWNYFFIAKTTVTPTSTVPITYNNKTFFLAVLVTVFTIIGIKHSIGKWALWICSREKEKGPLYSWLPNFLHSSYAEVKYKLVNKDEAISDLQKKLQDSEKINKDFVGYIRELKEAISITMRDRRLVHNLDNLIGKAFIMAAQAFTTGKDDADRLIRFMSQVCAEICSTTINNENNKHAYIFIRNYKADNMTLVGECRSGSNLSGILQFSKGEGFVGRVWEEGTTKLFTDIHKQAADIIVKKGERRYNSIVGVPIINGSEVIGIVVVSSQMENEVSEADVDNISRYLNIIQLGLLLEFSNLIQPGGDEYEVLGRVIQQKEQSGRSHKRAEENQ